ncbi:MAG: hypothetical protein SXQ77_05860 [Halobacteria archaeon]|nr:hypothetical protein [Halobacteria archaeon]
MSDNDGGGDNGKGTGMGNVTENGTPSVNSVSITIGRMELKVESGDASMEEVQEIFEDELDYCIERALELQEESSYDIMNI